MKYARFWIMAGLAGLAAVASSAAPAAAYVGPGAGLTLLGALWGLIAAIVMTVGFIVLWPFRRFLFARQRKSGVEADDAASGDAGEIRGSTMLANRSDHHEA